MAMNAIERSNHGANNSRKSKVKRPSAAEREPIASVEERDAVENRLERSLLVWLVLADLANGTAIAAFVFFMFPTPVLRFRERLCAKRTGWFNGMGVTCE